jgi:ArsR family transcriptional regulator, arsenate/arsenite/antimonite-responsive transcriptional repressor
LQYYFDIIRNMKSIEVVRALGALAQETRLAIYRLLIEHGPHGLTAGKIAETLDIVPATLSFHLKELSAAGLLNARTESRFIFYSARFDRMNELLSFLTANCCGGNPCTPVAVRLPVTRRAPMKVKA